MGKIIIVDRDNKEIGVKERSSLDYSKDIYRVSALWLTNSKGETLIAQRSLAKDKDPGLWGPAAAGTLDEGETYESNIYKEVEEEIGLTGYTFSEGPMFFVNTPRMYWGQYYLLQADIPIDDFSLQEDEVEAVKWIDVEELKQDVAKHPEKYVNNLGRLLKTLD